MEISMLDDTSGKVKEAMIFYTPTNSVVIEELVEALPDAKIYLPYSYTEEELTGLLTAKLPCNDNRTLQLAKRFLELSVSYPPIIELFSAHEESVSDWLRNLRAVSKKSSIRELPVSYDDVSAIYSKFRNNGDFREFVYLWLSLNNARHHQLKGSYQYIEALRKEYGKHLEAFPANDIIGNFSRDMIIAGRNKKGVLIQGKPDTIQRLTYNSRTKSGDARVAENEFWKNRYGIVPSSDIDLVLYEGGDLRAAKETLFVGQDTWLINKRAGYTDSHIEEELRRISGRDKIIVIGRDAGINFPQHLDMYFTPFDDKTVAVGDITPVYEYLESTRKLMPAHLQAHSKKQAYLDKVSAGLENMGFEVARIPLYLEFYTPRDYEERTAVMPIRSFANDVRNGNEAIVAIFGVPELDEPGYKVFERYGLKVKGITSAGSIGAFLQGDQLYATFESGGVRCLVNVLAKK